MKILLFLILSKSNLVELNFLLNLRQLLFFISVSDVASFSFLFKIPLSLSLSLCLIVKQQEKQKQTMSNSNTSASTKSTSTSPIEINNEPSEIKLGNLDFGIINLDMKKVGEMMNEFLSDVVSFFAIYSIWRWEECLLIVIESQEKQHVEKQQANGEKPTHFLFGKMGE